MSLDKDEKTALLTLLCVLGALGVLAYYARTASAAAPTPTPALPPAPPAPGLPAGPDNLGPGDYVSANDPRLNPTPSSPSSPSSPDAPSTPSTPSTPSADPTMTPVPLGSPITLNPGKRYRARLRLTGMAASLGTAPMIAEKFKALSFGGTNVYMTAAELPADWPAAYRTSAPGGGTTRWIEGSYLGTIPFSAATPPEIVEVWEWL